MCFWAFFRPFSWFPRSETQNMWKSKIAIWNEVFPYPTLEPSTPAIYCVYRNSSDHFCDTCDRQHWSAAQRSFWAQSMFLKEKFHILTCNKIVLELQRGVFDIWRELGFDYSGHCYIQCLFNLVCSIDPGTHELEGCIWSEPSWQVAYPFYFCNTPT